MQQGAANELLNIVIMKFIVNSEMLRKQLEAMSGTITSTTSICDLVGKTLSTSLSDYCVQPYQREPPVRLIGLNEARSSCDYDGTVHCFIDDSQFNSTWTTPDKHLPMLLKHPSVIGPDFSQHVDMSIPERLFNNYRNWCVTCYWQINGVNVIPNVSWSTPDLYDYNFCWIPTHSIIAIGSMGVLQYNISRYLFSKGYCEAIKRLEPRLIVRYGPKLPCEDESISLYFQNERLNRLRQKPRRRRQNDNGAIGMSNQLKLFNYGEQR